MKHLYMLLLISTVLFGAKPEVIEIGKHISDRNRDLFWPVFSNGGIQITESEVLMPNGDKLCIQSRFNDEEFETIVLEKDPKATVNVYKVLETKGNYVYSSYDEYENLYHRNVQNKKTGLRYGPFRTMKSTWRLQALSDGRIVESSLYRRTYLKHVFRRFLPGYNETPEEDEAKEVAHYENNPTYSVVIYDSTLNFLDSLNLIPRKGEDLRAYEKVYLIVPMDISSNDEIYLIDNADGYKVKIFNPLQKNEDSFLIKNKHYIPLPAPLTLKHCEEIKHQKAAYSVPYFLYVREEYVVTGFFQSAVWHQDITPPYYFDVTTLGGKPVVTGRLKYPIVAEDEKDKIFVFFKQPGGWLDRDRLFLVGFPIGDMVQGRVTDSTIEDAVAKYLKK